MINDDKITKKHFIKANESSSVLQIILKNTRGHPEAVALLSPPKLFQRKATLG